MNQTSIHHPDNVLTQINAFYWFHITQKQFLSCLSRSKDKCHFYRLFSVNIRRTFLVNLTSIFHANNVFNQPNSFYGFTWNSWNIFFRVSRVLKCLWSPSIILHTLSWCYDAECDPLPSYSFQSFIGVSIGCVHHSHWTEKYIDLKTQNNIWLIYFLPDVNECSADSNPCDDNADCSNTDGSYSCRCKTGFIGNGTTCQGS